MSMPQVSKYSTKQIEESLNDLLLVLQKQNATIDLSLMILGNATSHVLNQIPAEQRESVLNRFVDALKRSTTAP
jgi:uncharacterized protein YejL (UPF0352 family)